jgi:hypothetical protein
MNASARSEVVNATDLAQEHRSNPAVDSVLQSFCCHEQPLPHNPIAAYVSDEGAFWGFIGGRGI